MHSLSKRSGLLRSLSAVRESSVARERAEGEGEAGERLAVAVVAVVAADGEAVAVFSDIFVVFCCFLSICFACWFNWRKNNKGWRELAIYIPEVKRT